MRLQNWLATAFVIASLAAPNGAAHAQAFRVQPMSYDLEVSGSDATENVRVENVGERPLPVEARVSRRHINPDGSETTEPAESDFLVFPPQGVVNAGGFQTFRVQYVGPPVTESALYLVTIAQLPVETTNAEQSGVQFLFNVGTSAIVSPRNATARIIVASVEPSAQSGHLRVTVRNEGNRYARLRSGVWTITSVGRTHTLEGPPLHAAIAQPLIEPGATRILDLPVPADFPRTGATVAFELAAAPR